MTNNLERRVREHKSGILAGFTKKYEINKLVWYEIFCDINDAIATEKRLKGWRRDRKIKLIEENNPYWIDLADAF